MKNLNPDLRAVPSEAELQARIEWFEASRREADRLNNEAIQAQAQIRDHEFRTKLAADTGLSEEQLIAIRSWLDHNPLRNGPGVVQSFT
jgi:hypothetical protein